MANKSNLDKKRKEIILDFSPEELIAYITNISKKKINSIGFFSHDTAIINEGSLKDYSKYVNLQEDIINIYTDEANNSVTKQIKQLSGSGLIATIDYEELLDKYLALLDESKILFFKHFLIDLNNISVNLYKHHKYLKASLELFYLLYNGTKEEASKESLDNGFSVLISLIYNTIEANINVLDIYSDRIKALENILAEKPKHFSEALTDVIADIINKYNLCCSIVELIEDLKVNPFEEAINSYIIPEYISLIFEEPVEDLDSFKESLTDEEEIKVFNAVVNAFELTLPSYDFNNFKIIANESKG